MMNVFSSELTVLTAMIAPAVLISASGTLIFSTSTRLGRVVDRVRGISKQFEEMARREIKDDLEMQRLSIIFSQLDSLTSRARMLQRAMTSLYTSVGVLVATSVTIGFVSITQEGYSWIPVVLGLAGACFLFYGSILLMVEARLALASTYKEMDYLWEMGKRYAPAEFLKSRKR